MPAPHSSDAGAPHLSDEDLVASARQGDAAAWTALVNRYQRLVFSIPRRMRLSEDDATEIFDAVFAELWRSLGQLQQPGRLSAWLATVTRRRSLALLQYQRRWVTVSHTGENPEWSDLADPAPHRDANLMEAEREQQMRQAIERLPERCQLLFTWLFFTEPPPPYEEIARRMGVAANSVSFVRSRCLSKLRREWDALQMEPRARDLRS